MSKLICLVAICILLVGGAGAAKADTITIFPSSPSVGNCYPFDASDTDLAWGPFMAFVYQDIPSFNLQPGDILAFDLGLETNHAIQLQIDMSTSQTGPFTTVVSNTQTPADPNGDTTVGNFELQFTVEQAFRFPGGHLIIRFSNTAGNHDTSVLCGQVLVHGNRGDSSGYFVMRVWNDSDGVAPWDATDGRAIGAFQIITQDQKITTITTVPTMTEWGMIIFMFLAGLGSIYYLRRQRRA